MKAVYGATGTTGTNAGTYTAIATLVCTNDNYKLVGETELTLEWTIKQAEINVSGLMWTNEVTFTYDGTEKSVALNLAVIPEGLTAELIGKLVITYIGSNGINANVYTAAVESITSSDPNYVVVGVENIADCQWEIKPAEIDASKLEWAYANPFMFNGKEKTVYLKNVDESKLQVIYGVHSATNAGTHTATAVVESIDPNYVVVNEVPALTWVIVKNDVDVSDIVINKEYKYTLDENQTLEITLPANAGAVSFGAAVKVSDDGVISAIQVVDGKIVISLTGTAQAGDKATYTIPVVMDNYADITVTVNVTLLARDIPVTSTGDITVTYGEEIPAITGESSVPGVWELVKSSLPAELNAGTYDIQVRFVPADLDNYAEVTHTVTLTVVPAEIRISGVEWDYENPFAFNGSDYQVSLKNLPANVSVVYSGVRKVSNAGTYTVTATLVPTANYKLSGQTVYELTWKITPAVIDVSGYTWTSGSFVYDGTEKKVELVGVDSKLTITYTGNTATNAGEYTATATAVSNDPNYVTEGQIADCKWTIAKAKIDVSDYEWNYTGAFTFDGETKTVALKNVDSKLIAAYTDNAKTDAGTYTAKVTFAVADEYAANYEVDGSVEALIWTIAKAKIQVNDVKWNYTDAFTYDGNEKSVALTNLPEFVTVEYTGVIKATNAGKYTATATLSTDGNYELVGETELTLEWTINKAKINVSDYEWNYTGAFTFDGEAKTVELKSVDSKLVAAYTDNANTDAGTYTAKVTFAVADEYAANYEVEGSVEALSWEIMADKVTVPTVADTELVYNGEEQTVFTAPAGALYAVTGNTATTVGKYTLTFTLVDADNYTWSDGTVEPKTVEWTIVPAVIDVSGYTWTSGSFVYDGTEKKVELVGVDSKLTVTYTGNTGINAGSYTAKAVATCSDPNYVVEGVIADCSWTIEQASIKVDGVKWNYTDAFVYDGTEKSVALTNLPGLVTVTYGGTFKATNAGKYTATATLSTDGNHKLSGTTELTLEWTVSPAVINVSGYTWTSGSFVYDGTEKKVELVGVDSKLAITYTGNTGVNAGSYTAKAVATCSDPNYVVEGKIADCSWTIEQASIKVDGVKWNYTEAFVYDGTEKSVALINLPEFVKAVYGATGTTGINAGKYNAIATLVCTNDNYKLVGNTELELEWTIEQAEIKVDGVKWNYTDAFTYDGTEKSVALINLPEFVTATYDGTVKATNAGTYTATVKLATDGNHKLSGNTELTLEWTIEKAEIKVDGVKWNYTDAFTYDGTEKSVALINLPGLVTVTYGGTFKATNAGQYTATATLTTDGNHKLVGTTELELKWTVNKRTVVVPTIETLSFVFNGKEQTVYSEVPNAPYTLANNKATNVGSYKLTFILKDKANYVWNGLNTAEDQVINWTITKAELDSITVGGEYKRTETGDREYTFTLPADAGTVTFGEIVKTDANGVVSKISVVNGKVTVTLSGAASAGSTAQYVIPVTMSNYKDITITVNVNLMKADVPTVSVEDITVVYNGEAVNAAIIANFATANVSGKWTFVTDVSAMINAGTYDVVVKFTPDNLGDYLETTVNAKLVIKKATPTVAVKYNKVYAGGTLADAKLAVAESSVPGSVYWIEPVTTKVEKGVSYVWIFIPADETNYNTVSGSASLYQENAPINPIVPPAGWVNPYSDVREGTWYYDAVKFVTEKGLMNGVGNGKFAPGGTVTRATLMTILARRAGVNTNGGANWYEKGMAWAVAQGISDGTNPDADITREQIVTMMWRAVGCPDFSHVDLGRFNDGKTVSSWAEDAVKWAVGVGLLNGKDGNMLDPTGTATRAEMATILMRFVIYFG